MPKLEGNAHYQQIALDIAQCIVNGKYALDKPIYGRSTLSSKYNVSPETIRRAVALLQDMDVLTVHPRSGIMVNSIDNARNFIERFKCIHSIGSLQNDFNGLLRKKTEIEAQLAGTMSQIISYSNQLKNISPYNPIEVKVPEASHAIGCTVAQLRFWQNTGGTVIALRRGENVIVSPGPYAIISEGDSIVIVGNEGILQSVEQYLASPTPPERPITQTT